MSVAEQQRFVIEHLQRPVADDIKAMADYVRGQFAKESVVGVLGYGSCLGGVSTSDSLIDFYVLVRRAKHVSSNSLSSAACALLPPNVYYAELLFEDRILRTKYAVLDIDNFGQWVSDTTKNPYFWARFAQPSALVWVAGGDERDQIGEHICQAIKTMLGHCKALPTEQSDGDDLWQRGLVQTYRTELRAEGPARADEIVARNKQYYHGVSQHFGEVVPIKARWFWRRVQGKTFSVFRLFKASFTFTGGADYLAWKISRHSGVEIKLTDWQRRHPFLTAIYLLPGLLRKGAIR